ncbi:MAG: hypothetical protein F2667_04785 [Actinobacteria bacterium]|uniref:Unannotated protein n=1 Tax=freshwater metagenome TaxID=449393 RepID=A0A6J6PUG2_9ZZZZ|nr:hypothetical protein [Actinomycetota bacterium]
MKIATRARSAALVVATLAAATLAVAPHAEAADAPVISDVTTINWASGLTPYVPLYTYVQVSFTDSTPSPLADYRVSVAGIGSFSIAAPASTPGLALVVDSADLKFGQSYSYTVEELSGIQVVSTSAPATFTLDYVQAATEYNSSSVLVKGTYSYYAGKPARLTTVGEWAPGTTFTTQVWVSKTKTFTQADYDANIAGGALVARYESSTPLTSFKLPKALIGKYVWVSVVGSLEDKAGVTFTLPPERIIKKKR